VTTSYEYDAFGRVCEERQDQGPIAISHIDTTYDSLGSTTSETDQIEQVKREWQAPPQGLGGLLQTITYDPGSAEQMITNITPDAEGMEAERTTTLEIDSVPYEITRTVVERDQAGNVVAASLQLPEGTPILAERAFDAAGLLERQWGDGFSTGAATTECHEERPPWWHAPSVTTEAPTRRPLPCCTPDSICQGSAWTSACSTRMANVSPSPRRRPTPTVCAASPSGWPATASRSTPRSSR
jgi:hypothetical protein